MTEGYQGLKVTLFFHGRNHYADNTRGEEYLGIYFGSEGGARNFVIFPRIFESRVKLKRARARSRAASSGRFSGRGLIGSVSRRKIAGSWGGVVGGGTIDF